MSSLQRQATAWPVLGMLSPDVAAREPAAKIDDVLELERLIRRADPRIDNSRGSHAGD